MRVFIGMECSGEIRRAFEAEGHEAYSCDLKPAEDGSPFHIQADVFDVLPLIRPDIAILHPVCQFLSSSGYHWCYRDPARLLEVERAVDDFMKCVSVSNYVRRVVIENPIGIMSSRYRKPDQIIQPYRFGHNASKATCLWLFNLPLLQDTEYIEPRIVNGKPRWANQTDSGQNRLGPSQQRAADRSRTYSGIARAMARQWGKAKS